MALHLPSLRDGRPEPGGEAPGIKEVVSGSDSTFGAMFFFVYDAVKGEMFLGEGRIVKGGYGMLRLMLGGSEQCVPARES